MKKHFQYFKSQRGQSLTEFALVIPIFVIVLCGIVEFSRMYETANVITSAARAGARVAAVTNPSVTQATNAARAVLTAANIYNASVSVSGPNSSNQVTVTVRLSYQPVAGSILPGVSGLTISRSSVMYWEG